MRGTELQRLLVITNDNGIATRLQSQFVRTGYRVGISTFREDELLEAVGRIVPEVLIIDCRSNAGGATSIRQFLAKECNLRELLVIGLMSISQTSKADWTGIDEFILEPFDGEELLARLSLMHWRTRGIDVNHAIRIGALIIDTLNYEVSIDALSIELTFKEFELLSFLAMHPGRVFTRGALLDHVWGYDYYGGTRTIDVHIRRLRSKLAPSYDSLIETVRNVGYRFVIPGGQGISRNTLKHRH